MSTASCACLRVVYKFDEPRPGTCENPRWECDCCGRRFYYGENVSDFEESFGSVRRVIDLRASLEATRKERDQLRAMLDSGADAMRQMGDAHQDLEAELAAKTKDYDQMRAIVAADAPYLPGCDSYAHDDGCPYADILANFLRIQSALKAANKIVDALRAWRALPSKTYQKPVEMYDTLDACLEGRLPDESGNQKGK